MNESETDRTTGNENSCLPMPDDAGAGKADAEVG
jgi:hypothetical protein